MRDPELRYSADGKPTCRFDVAVDKPWHKEGEQSADFFPVRAFGKQAEASGQNLVKGQMVEIKGRMESRTYEKDGVRKTIWELLAEHVQFGAKPKGYTKQQQDGGDDYGDDEPVPY